MEKYSTLKKKLLNINSGIKKLLSESKNVSNSSDGFFESWESICSNIEKQVAEDIVRVAVVGPIKSGKSTFVNSLFKGDYLKRGAGVVTSIVTRIKNGQELKARLFFKSWDEVNSDMEQALVLFPAATFQNENEKYDIRRSKDRENLQEALDALKTEHLITDDARNINSVLLTSYLKGYDRVKDIIASDTITRDFEGDDFVRHREFSGDEILAVYLRDIQLEIDDGDADNNIEIADCQGSDSPNPLHLLMIQDYLLVAHLLVYVISSRTGLRRADIRFLSMIRKMGMMDNILFVINCDFSEHESIADLKSLVDRVREELSLIKPDPAVYAVSGLYNLFKAKKESLTSKDMARFDQWVKEKDISAFSDSETEKFETAFENKLSGERFSLLLKNHFKRLRVIASGLNNWASINQDMIARDSGSVNEITEKIRQHQKTMQNIRDMIKNTLDGAVQKIKKELRVDVDHFFDDRSGDIMLDIIDFIRAYKVSYENYEENITVSGFPGTMYMVFQEFKQALDTFMAEQINPRVIGFIRDEETKIMEYLESIAGSYDGMVQDALIEYKNTIGELVGVELDPADENSISSLDIDSLRSVAGLHLPPAVAVMHYSATIKTEAILRFGFFSLYKVFLKIFKKKTHGKKGEFNAIEGGVIRMKREAEKSVGYHFRSYRENIKFQYVFKLADAVSGSLCESLLGRFNAYDTDLVDMTAQIDEKQLDKEQVFDILKNIKNLSADFGNKISHAGREIDAC